MLDNKMTSIKDIYWEVDGNLDIDIDLQREIEDRFGYWVQFNSSGFFHVIPVGESINLSTKRKFPIKFI